MTITLSLSGGTDKTRFLASLGYMDNPGLVDRTGVKQYKMRVNLEADVTKWLTAGARIYGDMKDQEVGNFSNANNYLRQRLQVYILNGMDSNGLS